MLVRGAQGKGTSRADRKQATVWDIATCIAPKARPTICAPFNHSTQKPVDCMRIPIEQFESGDLEASRSARTTITALDDSAPRAVERLAVWATKVHSQAALGDGRMFAEVMAACRRDRFRWRWPKAKASETETGVQASDGPGRVAQRLRRHAATRSTWRAGGRSER